MIFFCDIKNRYKLFVVVLVLSAALTGCTKDEKMDSIDLPPTPILSMEANWGVVNTPYLRVRNEPDIESEVILHLRSGFIAEVHSKSDFLDSIDDLRDYWYEISYDGVRGWVYGTYLDLYDSRDKAENASKDLR